MRQVISLISILGLIFFLGATCAKHEEPIAANPEPVMTDIDATSIAEGAIYTSPTYGFTFKYDPAGYEVITEKSRGGALGEEGDLITLRSKSGDDCPEKVDIFLSPATYDQEREDIEKRIAGTTTPAVISGQDAIQRQGELTENLPPCGSEVIELIFPDGEDVYIFRASKDSEELLNLFLTSFKL